MLNFLILSIQVRDHHVECKDMIRKGKILLYLFLLISAVGLLFFQSQLLRRAVSFDKIRYEEGLKIRAFRIMEDSLGEIILLSRSVKELVNRNGLQGIKENPEHVKWESDLLTDSFIMVDKDIYHLDDLTPLESEEYGIIKNAVRGRVVKIPLDGSSQSQLMLLLDWETLQRVISRYQSRYMEGYGMKLVSLENLKGKIRFPQVIEVPLSLSYLISQKSDLEDEMNNTWEGMAEFIDEWGASSILYIFEESKTHLNGLERHVWLQYLFSILSILILFSALALLIRQNRIVHEQRRREQEFTASVSHELKTPLSVIQALGDNMKAGLVKDKNKAVEYGGSILSETTRLKRMVVNILSYSEQEAQSLPVAGNCRPREIVDSLKRQFSSLTLSSDILWKIEQLPAALPMEGKELFSLLDNLIMNGDKYHKQEGQVITVRIGVKYPPSRLHITIEDRGVGIPSMEQKKSGDHLPEEIMLFKSRYLEMVLGFILLKR
jgi:signal transduction histidine kinase